MARLHNAEWNRAEPARWRPVPAFRWPANQATET